MLKRECGAERNGKLPLLSISSKTAVWAPEFAVEDLPLSRTATLVPENAVKDLPLGRILDDELNGNLVSFSSYCLWFHYIKSHNKRKI